MTDLSDLLQRADKKNHLTLRERSKRIEGRLHFGTLAAYQRGEHPEHPDAETLLALSDAYGVPLREVQEAAGGPVGAGEWTPPAENDAA